MNLPKMIAELQAERQRLDEAIAVLERLAASNRKRRGRPPRWGTQAVDGHSDVAAQTETTGQPPESS